MVIGGVADQQADEGPSAAEGHIPAAGQSGAGWIRSRPANVVTLVVFAVCAGSVFWYVHRFAQNVLFYDQWTDVDILHHLHGGTLGLGTLWAQHAENRTLFPRLVVLILGVTTHLDVVVEDYLSAALWCGFAASLIAAHRRRSPSMPWLLYCPVALALLSFVPVEDALFGFDLTWFLALFALGATLLLLDRMALSWPWLVLAAAAAVVGSFSSVQGMFIWPAGLALLLLRGRRRRVVVAAWVVLAAGTVVAYLAGFDLAQAGGSDTSLLYHPLFRVEFFLSVIGNVFGLTVGSAPRAVNLVAVALGLVVLVVAALAVIRGCRPAQRSGASPIGVALIGFGLLCAVSAALGRVQFGVPSAGRYDVFAVTIWVGSYLALLVPPRVRTPAASLSSPPADRMPSQTVVARAVLVVLVVLMAAQVVVSVPRGLLYGRRWQVAESEMADVTANINDASDALVQQALGGYPPSEYRRLAAVADAQGLSLFGTPVAAADRRSGLFVPLVTSVLRPDDGTTISGSVVLDASVGVRLENGAATLTFEVRRAGLPPTTTTTTVVGRPTLMGWLGRWDSASVADGIYLIQSVLVRPGRPAVSSDPITVHVRNPG